MAAHAAAAKPLRPTPAIPASPPDFVSMLRSLFGTDAPVAGADDGKGISDDGGIVAVVLHDLLKDKGRQRKGVIRR
ncbi:hypothetical protein AZE42_05180 [Rhizopogon vesiculosus]|uniref:Uncharacterized protein n=1 Tax=Rhizopogon vesiculosus TaxID=180088 RepID=A0A1J8QXX1_9AGAM|nr:hypothetical protein AZE42_05180 [Rhizopogon vesiculosus]